jgi:26S proteasome regulatory subunit N5
MEVIQWTTLWEFFKEEYENEKNYLGGALGDKAAEDLKLRIIEHVCSNFLLYFSVDVVPVGCSIEPQFFRVQNILVVSKYYSRITLKRLADLLCLSLQVCNLVPSGVPFLSPCNSLFSL